jgi:hypothetical protein
MKAVIAVILFLTSLFDMPYGSFKKITKTSFEQNDTRYYTSLCVVISILTPVLSFVNNYPFYIHA